MEAARAYVELTDQLVDALGTSHSMMHLHAGLTIFLLTQLVVRTRRGSIIAVNTVFAAEVLNELLGFLGTGRVDWHDTASDFALTMMWPVAITLVSQFRRARWERKYLEKRAAAQWRRGMIRRNLSPRALAVRAAPPGRPGKGAEGE